MRQVLLRIVSVLARPFLGSNISKHLPWTRTLYQRLFSRLNAEGLLDLPYRDGLTISVSARDNSVGAKLRLHAEYEPTTAGLFVGNIRADDIVFDVGANIGTFALLAAKHVSQDGQVHAFEPSPETASLLVRNLRQNGFLKASVNVAAIGDQRRDAFLVQQLADAGGSFVDVHGKAPAGSVAVPMITLDDYCREHGITAIQVMKIDIEGAELMALRGAAEILRASRGMRLFMEINTEALGRFSVSVDDLLIELQHHQLAPTTIVDERNRETFPYTKSRLDSLLRRDAYVNIMAVRA